jgi:hypothetical protein
VNGYSPKSDADADIFSQLGGYSPKKSAAAAENSPENTFFCRFLTFWHLFISF